MPSYKAPVEDVLFLLNDVLAFHRYDNLRGFADASADVIEAVLNEGAKLAETVLAPLNAIGDREGCTRHPDGSVTTPKGFKTAYDAYANGGWMGLSMPEAFGGQALPHTLNIAIQEFASAANLAARHVSGPDPGGDGRPPRPRLGGAEGDLPAPDGRGRLDRHHEPDRAPLRHRPRPAQDQGGPEG